MLKLTIQGVKWPNYVPELFAEPEDPEVFYERIKAIKAMEKRGIRLLKTEECKHCGSHYA